MNRKILINALVSTLLISALASCGGTSSTTDKTESDAGTSGIEATESAAPVLEGVSDEAFIQFKEKFAMLNEVYHEVQEAQQNNTLVNVEGSENELAGLMESAESIINEALALKKSDLKTDQEAHDFTAKMSALIEPLSKFLPEEEEAAESSEEGEEPAEQGGEE